jgi:hypothetical protein
MFLTQQGYSLNPDLEEKQQSHITNAPNTRAKTEVYFIETTECADALDTQNSRQGDILIRKQLKYSLNKFANRYSSNQHWQISRFIIAKTVRIFTKCTKRNRSQNGIFRKETV